MKKLSLFLIFIVAIFSGCAPEPQIVFDKPKMQIKTQEPQASQNKGSLYSSSGTSLFADKKDMQQGDIIQVIIDETLSANSKNSRSTSKSNSTDLGGALVAPMTGVTNTPGTTDRVNRINNAVGVGVTTNTANTFAGKADTKFDEKFRTTVSVIIEETYQNGNYFIKGSKEMLIDGQKQEIIISGVIRPYDITPENSVLSSQVANLKVSYKKLGEEADNLEKGWGSKALEAIWPF